VAEIFAPQGGAKSRSLAAVELATSPFLRAVLAEVRDLGNDRVAVDSEATDYLGIGTDGEIILLPLE
jgi:hypothetical protein